jgi:hypothetical protein
MTDEQRIARLEAEIANHHSILRDLAEQQKQFYAALTALQKAFDVVCLALDPKFRPEPQAPRRDLM